MASATGPGWSAGSAAQPPEWQSTDLYARTQLAACLRAVVIALVLLAVLAFIVLF